MALPSTPARRPLPRFSAALLPLALLATGCQARQPQGQQAGDLEITAPWVRATPPNARAAAGFLTIRNHGSDADRLLAADADVTSNTQIHDAGMDGGIMRMRQVRDGVEIPADGTVAFEPGSYHLMLMAPPEPLVAGQVVRIQLQFERAGTVDVAFPVRPIGATSASDEHEAH